jgi:hypothetical protein
VQWATNIVLPEIVVALTGRPQRVGVVTDDDGVKSRIVPLKTTDIEHSAGCHIRLVRAQRVRAERRPGRCVRARS